MAATQFLVVVLLLLVAAAASPDDPPRTKQFHEQLQRQQCGDEEQQTAHLSSALAVVPAVAGAGVLSEEMQQRERVVRLPLQATADATNTAEFRLLQDWDGVGLGCVVWEASLILATFLLHNRSTSLATAAVVELGAGCGLPGIVAASLGASVVLTDRASVLHCTEANVQHNKHTVSGTIAALPLEWGKGEESVVQQHFGRLPQVVVGADLIYGTNTTVYQLLIETLDALSAPTTSVFIAGKRRYREHRAFRRAAAEQGWNVATLDITQILAALGLGSDAASSQFYLWQLTRHESREAMNR